MAEIQLKTKDDTIITVRQAVAEMSVTLKNLIEDLSDGALTEAIPLATIRKEILKPTLKWCETHMDDDKEDKRFEEYQLNADLLEEDVPIFDALKPVELFEIIKAANFLDIYDLMDSACKALVLRVHGKSLEENAKQFGIDREITMEDKVRAIERHPWILKGCNIIPAHVEMKEAYYAKHPDRRPKEDDGK
eukprot:TRINITY_DN11765_c0_g3_i1.p2 TRINITY_DN11765_c0_g3~~TRINITY_DN11765_c0_g3_i1.p2  ORF type:complete len:191 (+),score=59.69 TRINITY_DN11765_c0_g3_i1:1498-2070(+)